MWKVWIWGHGLGRQVRRHRRLTVWRGRERRDGMCHQGVGPLPESVDFPTRCLGPITEHRRTCRPFWRRKRLMTHKLGLTGVREDVPPTC